MAQYSVDTRNVIAAALAAWFGGSRLFLLSETGRTLAVLNVPALKSENPGEIETGAFPRDSVVASGKPTRYEIRQSSGLVQMSGAGAELRINPPTLVEGGLVYIDSFVLTV